MVDDPSIPQIPPMPFMTARPAAAPRILDVAIGKTDAKLDPAPNPLHVNRDKLLNQVNDVAGTALKSFGSMRDELDDVMRAITEQKQHIVDLIEKLAQDCESGLKTVDIVNEQLAKLREQIRVAIPKTIPKANSGRP